MKITKMVLGATTALVIALSTMGAKASATSNRCTVVGVPVNSSGRSFTENDRHITSTFTVAGSNCTMSVTLAVWKSPSADGQPIHKQRLYSHSTRRFAPGQHSLTAKLPDCYYQADLVEGSSPTAADGTANYDYQNGVIFDGGLRDYKFGGSNVCKKHVKPTPKPTPTPTPTPTPPQVQGAATVLPNTGISGGSVLGIGFAVALLGTAVHQFVQRRFTRS